MGAGGGRSSSAGRESCAASSASAAASGSSATASTRRNRKASSPLTSCPVETAAGTKHHLLALLGRINHWAFYAVLLVMPVLGAIAWFGGSEAAGALHGLLAWVLVLLIVLHVGGAILHLVLGENIFRRMLRSSPGT